MRRSAGSGRCRGRPPRRRRGEVTGAAAAPRPAGPFAGERRGRRPSVRGAAPGRLRSGGIASGPQAPPGARPPSGGSVPPRPGPGPGPAGGIPLPEAASRTLNRPVCGGRQGGRAAPARRVQRRRPGTPCFFCSFSRRRPAGRPRFAAAARLEPCLLEFEHVYLENLPCASMYERSYMHRDVITHVACTK
uniref:Uncharacterized protein n=1 Tax=Accipiter nisus TaxID=211598 RepID=A0A8B9MS35_9AVES